MSVQLINDLTMSMQNVMPAQVYAPLEQQALPDEVGHDLETEVSQEAPVSSSTSCSCVDTYA